MPRLTVVVEKNRFPEVAKRFPVEVDRIRRLEGLAFEDGAVSNVVKYQVIDSGTLMGSIAFNGDDEVADNVDYGEYQDKGTVFIAPRPFWSDELGVSRRRYPLRFQELRTSLL